MCSPATSAAPTSRATSTPKRFKAHVKANHKRELQQVDGTRTRPYREFLSREDVDALRRHVRAACEVLDDG